MPLREISTNAQSVPRGARAKAKQTVKNPWKQNRHQLPLLANTSTTTTTSASFKPYHDTSAFPPLPKVANQQLDIHFDKVKVSVDREKEVKKEQTPQPENVFFDTVQDWDAFLVEDISMWSTSPRFKQSDASICCLLCGKNIRGDSGNEALVRKHVSGYHHKKTFQLMENLQTLKQQQPSRFGELIKAVMEPNNQPLPKCTPKQLLAYYHNVAIQARQSKKPLEGIATHFRRRFLNDKLQMCDTDNTTKASESKTVCSLEKIDKVTTEVKSESSTPEHCSANTAPSDTHAVEPQTNSNVGDEENTFGLVVRSPLARNAKALQPSVDTPMPGASKKNEQDAPDSSTKTAAGKKHQDSKESTLASLGSKIENGACESPSSDISVQSELCWMASISELGDILSDRHEIFDGTLDEELVAKMLEEDAEVETSGMGMPMMVVTRLESMEDIDVNSFFSSVEFDDASEALPAIAECTEQNEISDVDAPSSKTSPNKKKPSATTTDVPISLPAKTSPKQKQASITTDGDDENSVLSSEETEYRLEIQRSLECIAALAFTNV